MEKSKAIEEQSLMNNITYACLFFCEDRWSTFCITTEMIQKQKPMIFIQNKEDSNSIDDLEIKILNKFPEFGGFDDTFDFLILMKNSGYKKPDFKDYPQKTHPFLMKILDYIWIES